VYPAIAIVGPTASGKSDLGLYLAECFDGEIINYDSLQLFRYLDIGTAKPSKDEQSRVPHHLIDILDPDEAFSAGQYQSRAREVLDDIRKRNRLPILVGGTGLYLRAVMEGLFDGPQRSTYWRTRMEAIAGGKGREYLHSLLDRLDPSSAARIAARDLPKVIRALEVRLTTGRNLSSHLDAAPRRPIQGFAFNIVGLDPSRDVLYERIEERVRWMWEVGLVEEVKQILERGVTPRANAFRAIGYRQVLEYIDGAVALDEAIMSTGRETRRYAKRQLTWFKKQHSVTWFGGFGGGDDTKERVYRFINHIFGNSGRIPGSQMNWNLNEPSLGN